MSSSGDSPGAAPTTPANLLTPNNHPNIQNGGLGLGDEQISEDEARKRREQLNRRPSYRMILKDLETADKNLKKEPEDTPPSSNEPPPLPLHVQIPSARGLPGPSASPYGSPLGASLLPPPSSAALPHALGFPLNGDLQPQLHLADYTNSAALAAAVVAASQGRQLTPTSSQHELPGQGTPSGSAGLLLPGADLHGLKPPMSDLAANPFANHVGQNWQQQLLSGYNSSPSPVSSRVGGPGGLGCEDESTRKRQVRLLKNREAAKECRRKKKEYVKCLENRVAVLENQNKALIEELKTLKELYCRKEKQEGL